MEPKEIEKTMRKLAQKSLYGNLLNFFNKHEDYKLSMGEISAVMGLLAHAIGTVGNRAGRQGGKPTYLR